MAGPRVLIVEDDTSIRTLLVAALRREPVEVHTAPDGVAALELIRAHEYAVILLDLMMPHLNGFEFLEAFGRLRLDRHPVILVMTAFDPGAVKHLGEARVHAIVHKPFDIERVVEMVRDTALLYARQHPEKHRSSDSTPADETAAAADDLVC